MLGALFVAVTLLLPRGIVGTVHHWWGEWRARRQVAKESLEAVQMTDMARDAAPRAAE